MELVREEEYDHITLAFSYGDGAKGSCENTVREVSELLKAFPIDHYMAADMSTINLLNDAVGGVTVMVPSGMEQADPELLQGSQITLKGKSGRTLCPLPRHDPGSLGSLPDFSGAGIYDRIL